MNILGLRIEKWVEKKDSTVREMELVNERSELKKQIGHLSEQVKDLSARVKTPFVNADLGDPTPIGTEERQLYVAAVAGLHKDILEPKLKYMIANIHNSMEEEGNTALQDAMWKGAIYFAREMMRWGNRCVNEQVANQNNQK